MGGIVDACGTDSNGVAKRQPPKIVVRFPDAHENMVESLLWSFVDVFGRIGFDVVEIAHQIRIPCFLDFLLEMTLARRKMCKLRFRKEYHLIIKYML